MNRVDGRIALVSGAGGGIGAATCAALLAGGARVVATDRFDAPSAHLAPVTAAAGDRCLYLRADVTVGGDWQRAVDTAVARFGGLDILVNNAGLYRTARIEEVTDEQIDLLFGVNLKGVVLGTRHAIGAMKKRPAGADSASIINLSSIAGLVGASLASVYSLTKGGVRLFTKSTALEVAMLGYNIRCNSVHPGIVDTDMGAQVAETLEARGMTTGQARAAMAANHPIGRLAQPGDIARAIVFLASNDSSFMTGSEVVVDGGWTAR
ncbi:MAG TPA: SDR family oxidoreductase [Burkholderiaceae bacterium]|nr:SDR family oxidoreductase [Burkholderiaceae bacterium]